MSSGIMSGGFCPNTCFEAWAVSFELLFRSLHDAQFNQLCKCVPGYQHGGYTMCVQAYVLCNKLKMAECFQELVFYVIGIPGGDA